MLSFACVKVLLTVYYKWGRGVLYSINGNLKVAGVDLDADESPPGADAGYADCAAAHEGVKNNISRIRSFV
jgi:hypothetical protein